jgi:hypothetical protein
MKTQLIKLPQGNIIVSDEEIRDGKTDFYTYDNLNHKVLHIEYIKYFGDSSNNGRASFRTYYGTNSGTSHKEVIASSNPSHNLPSIDYNGFEQQLGVVDVEKLAKEYFNNKYAWIKGETAPYKEKDVELIKSEFIEGFKKAQSLNNNKFSLDNIRDAFEAGEASTIHRIIQERNNYWEFNDFLKSLQQPKVFDIEVEMENYRETGYSASYKLRPKITNNQIRILKKL